jgi:hypothetical protein
VPTECKSQLIEFSGLLYADYADFRDNGADVTGKLLSHMKFFSKRSDFLRFYLYLCHAIEDFACLDFAALRQVENMIWQNSEQLFVA